MDLEYLFFGFHRLDFTNSNDIAKNLLKVSKCLSNVLDKVLVIVLTFSLWWIIWAVIYEITFDVSFSSKSQNFFPVCSIKHFRRNITSKMRHSNDRKGKDITFVTKCHEGLVALFKKVQNWPFNVSSIFFFEFKHRRVHFFRTTLTFTTIIYSCRVIYESENAGKSSDAF